MATIAQALRFHLARRAASSPAFGKLSILLSDAATPGEGEHKIASIIREQRNQPGYDPDTTHLLYGLDADLVMIGLATHERRFYILRDWVPLGRQKFAEVCDLCGREGHTASSCTLLQAARAARLTRKERPHWLRMLWISHYSSWRCRRCGSIYCTHCARTRWPPQQQQTEKSAMEAAMLLLLLLEAMRRMDGGTASASSTTLSV